MGRWVTAGEPQQRCGFLSSWGLEITSAKGRLAQLIETEVGKSLKERTGLWSWYPDMSIAGR